MMAVRFTALLSKQLKTDFEECFSYYKQNLKPGKTAEPNTLKQKAAVVCQKFFGKLQNEVKLL